MDDLFDRAGEAFVGGDLDLALESYGQLLHAFRLEEDGEVFCGPSAPTEMVATDVTEAKSRYLRALYETAPPSSRPGRLVEEMAALWCVGDPSNLRAIVDARPEALDLDGFLPGWIEELKSLAQRWG